MTAGITQFSIGFTEHIFIAQLDSNGVPKGITGTVASGSYGAFREAKGVIDLSGLLQAGGFQTQIGSNSIQSTFYERPREAQTFSLGTVVLDSVILDNIDNRTNVTVSDWVFSPVSKTCQTLNNMALIVVSQAVSNQSGSVGESGYATTLIWNVQMEEVDKAFSGTTLPDGAMQFNCTANSVDTTWWEESISNYGVNQALFFEPFWTENPVTGGTYVGDATSSQTFTVDTSFLPATQTDTGNKLWEDGTIEAYTTDYTNNLTTGVYSYVNDPADGSDNVLLYEFTKTC